MQMYIEKIKAILRGWWLKLRALLEKITAKDLGRIFFWLFVGISLLSALGSYLVFWRTPSLPPPSSQTLISIPQDVLNTITSNATAKQSFAPPTLSRDPFAL